MRNRDLEQSGSKPRSNLYSSDNDYDEAEEHWKPWLVPVLVVLNVVVFVIVMYVNDCPKHVRRNGFVDGKCVGRFLGRFSFEPLSENPLFGPSSNALAKMGALDRSRILYDHQSWRLITNIWFHAGLIHLLVNMLSLNNIMVGASGALFGLLGAMLSELITNWTIYTNKIHSRTTDAVSWKEWISALPLVPLPHLHPNFKMEVQYVIATACCNVRASILLMV
ncbi:RHOMBOID-like protein [Drosera capensis]